MPKSLIGLFAGMICFLLGHDAGAQSNTTPGELISYSTYLCVGLEWSISGDNDNDAICTIKYRIAGGADPWKDAMPLMRIDYQSNRNASEGGPIVNMFAGSIFNLVPGTQYEVEATLSDPDGGADKRTVTIATRSVPVIPTGGRTWHVEPGTGGGDGSINNKFKGIAAAEAIAQPGDIFLLHAGYYGNALLNKSGGPNGQYIVWKAAGDGDAVFMHVIIGSGWGPNDVQYDYLPTNGLFGNHLWIEGLKIIPDPAVVLWGHGDIPPVKYCGIDAADVEDLVITKNNITDVNAPINISRMDLNPPNCKNAYIADNVMVGNLAKVINPDPNYSDAMHSTHISINSGSGHVICHNSVTQFAYGFHIGHAVYNLDIYGNDVWQNFTDLVKLNAVRANTRIFENRVTMTSCYTIAMQQYSGPAYVVRNQFVTASGSAFIFRATSRFLMANNLFAGYGAIQGRYGEDILRSKSRNNLWIYAGTNNPDWNTSQKNGHIWDMSYYYGGIAPNGIPWDTSYVLPNGYLMPNGTYSPTWETDLDYDGFDGGPTVQPFNMLGGAFTFNQLRTSSGLEKHGKLVKKEDIFQNWNLPDEWVTGLSPSDVELQAGAPYAPPKHYVLKTGVTNAAVDAGDILPTITDGFAGAAPDLGPFEVGAPLPHYGPRQYPVRTGRNWYDTAGGVGIQPKFESQVKPSGLFLGTLQGSALSHSIQYSVPQAGSVQIRVHNLFGQEACCLLNKEISAGIHTLNWDGKDASGKTLADGVYAIRMQADGQAISKKMVMIK